MFWSSIASNLASDIIYTVIISILAIIFTAVFVGIGRRRLFSFFSIDRSKPELTIYLSRIDVRPGGTNGTDGPTQVGFVGPALDQMEYLGALEIKKLFLSHLVEAIPRAFKRSLQMKENNLSEVAVQIDATPDEPRSIEVLDALPSGMVLIGSDVYSHLARAAFNSSATFVHFVSEQSGEPYRSGISKFRDATFSVCTDDPQRPWQTISRKNGSSDIGIIQRISLSGKQPLIMCAGNSSISTHLATLHLCSNWRQYDREFNGDDFLVVLEITVNVPWLQKERRIVELKDLRRRRSPIG